MRIPVAAAGPLMVVMMIVVLLATQGVSAQAAGSKSLATQPSRTPPGYRKYGGIRGRNGKYLVQSVNYGGWFTNTSEGACEESLNLCTAPGRCPLTREVTLDELRAECPRMVPDLGVDKQTVLVQTGAGGTGSTWQLRSLIYLLSYTGIGPREFHSNKRIDISRLASVVRRDERPIVIKTHQYAREDFNSIGDIFFTSFNLRHRKHQLCARTHPNVFVTKSCPCCFAAWHTKNVYSVRLAELMGAAASLGLDIESIDFDAVLDSVSQWYRRKYHKPVNWI